MNKKQSKKHAVLMVKGIRVKMVNCFEAEYHTDEIFTVRSDGPVILGGDWVVWLDGYAGAFRCDFLEIVNI